MPSAPLQPMEQQQQRQLWPSPLPFPVKSGFLKSAREPAAAAKTTPKPPKPRGRKVAARCRVAGCGGRPWFAQPGSRVPKACKDHKEEGEVNIYTRTCEVDGCGTRPHYGIEGERARFCCTHKLGGMVDVLNKRCAAEGCRRQPSWARKEGARARFCKEHKDDGMVDTKHRRCLHPGCTRFPSKSAAAATAATPSSLPRTRPVANPVPADSQASKGSAVVGDGDASPPLASSGSGPPGAAAAAAAAAAVPPASAEAPGPARYCAAHAPTGAVNVTASRCKHPGGCSVQPYFGREGGGQPAEFCARHRKKGMTDVRNPRCRAMGCTAQPRCGNERDPRPLFCLRHAEPGMVNFRSEGYRESAPAKRRKASKSPALER